MKKLFIFLISIFTTLSCSNDIDKEITTDLQVEANEIFEISLAIEESLRFALYSFEDYKTSGTTAIMGCPLIEWSDDDMSVKLTFVDIETGNCPTKKISRMGTIKLSFEGKSSDSELVTIEYDNYKVRKKTLEGKRTFYESSGIGSTRRVNESFEDLLIIDEDLNSSKISGNYQYQIQYLNDSISNINSNGILTGRNKTGRAIKMQQTAPRVYRKECLNEGLVIASSGIETWEMSRSTTHSVTHTLTFTQLENCESRASIRLNDGRVLNFTP
ncbi:hypothetical protein ACFOUP_11655 [Belliella kenyensis]|uniref:Lipoprotein n=1 Tax=Belliella kenyensis TaxID=1472724 RepID=A0ABV8EPG6_9BACT|nr:hypothetical protein [Belliella kenyensis]MCH7400618.1 hypothetical protein [Belliella kenyensis]MDN3602095.1 hypothetical protein [Belliella kenyensis]